MVEVTQEVRWVPEFCPECHCRSFADVDGGGGTVRCMNCKSVYTVPDDTAITDLYDDKERVRIAAFNAGLEAAAKVAEQWPDRIEGGGIADAILALKGEE